MDTKLCQRAAVCLAVMGICLPQMALAATNEADRAFVAANVQLRDGGVLLGQALTAEHVALAGTPVTLHNQAGEEVAKGKTDKNGYFAFRRLPQGVYRVVVENGYRDFRAWTRAAAPPAAQNGLLVVSDKGLARGQNTGGLLGFATSPLGIGLLVATSIAVPVAIHNSRSASP